MSNIDLILFAVTIIISFIFIMVVTEAVSTVFDIKKDTEKILENLENKKVKKRRSN